MDKVIGIVDARTHIKEIVEGAASGLRYIITSRSKPKAVLVSVEEFETLEVMADKDLMKDILEAKEDIKTGRLISADEFFGTK
jgi:prevent-host-death family protein